VRLMGLPGHGRPTGIVAGLLSRRVAFPRGEGREGTGLSSGTAGKTLGVFGETATPAKAMESDVWLSGLAIH